MMARWLKTPTESRKNLHSWDSLKGTSMLAGLYITAVSLQGQVKIILLLIVGLLLTLRPQLLICFLMNTTGRKLLRRLLKKQIMNLFTIVSLMLFQCQTLLKEWYIDENDRNQ